MPTRRALLGAAALLPMPAIAQARIPARFAVGGVALYSYMPFFVALGQDLFAKHGLAPDVAMFPGGAKALQAVLGGSSDIACGYYEHTIQIAAKGGRLAAFVLQAQNSGLALGVRAALAEVKTIADLRCRRIGVSAPGSSTHMFVMRLFARAGLKPTDFAAIGVGTTQTAISALTRGEVDALSSFDPVIMALEQSGTARILADARSSAGSEAIFGGPYA